MRGARIRRVEDLSYYDTYEIIGRGLTDHDRGNKEVLSRGARYVAKLVGIYPTHVVFSLKADQSSPSIASRGCVHDSVPYNLGFQRWDIEHGLEKIYVLE